MKKVFAAALAASMMLSMAACGKTEDQPISDPDIQKVEASGTVGIANPIHDGTAAEVAAATGLLLELPDGAENAAFSWIDGEQPTAQVRFDLNGSSYNYRAVPADTMVDISGLHYDWKGQKDTQVGACEAQIRWNEGEAGYVGWYDAAPGLLYNLSMTENATSADLETTARLIFAPAQSETDGDFDARFAATLQKIADGYAPGTAGTSLRAAGFAAELADLFTEQQPDAASVRMAVADYSAALDGAAKDALRSELTAVAVSFAALDDTLLSACGYEAKYAPFDTQALCPLFDALANADAPSYFSGILTDYAEAMKNHTPAQELRDSDRNYMIASAENALDEIGYGFLTDDSGALALVIGTVNASDDFNGKLIYDLYAVPAHTGMPTLLFRSQERNRLYSAGERCFANVGSSSAFDSFSAVKVLENGTLTDAEGSVDATDYVQLALTPFSRWEEESAHVTPYLFD